jgi:hypothetical protein
VGSYIKKDHYNNQAPQRPHVIMSQLNEQVNVTLVSYWNPVDHKNVTFSPALDGLTLRQILSGFFDGKEVITIDIHDGSWHDMKKASEVLDTVYIHNGPRFSVSKYASLNIEDVTDASSISSARGLRVRVAKST